MTTPKSFLRVLTAALVCLGFGSGLAGLFPPAFAVEHGNRLWYDEPAVKWVEALPVGNGRISAMVFGGVGEERLQLNEGTLWAGGP